MAIFGKKKDEETKDDAVKSAVSVSNANVKNDGKKSMKDLYSDDSKTDSGKKNLEKKVEVKNGRAYRVLVRPLITEKVTNLAVENKYAFEVATDTNKIEVSRAIQEVYGVVPTDVNIVNVKGKKVRFGRKFGKRKDWKKAIITLKKGETIKVYEGV